jgi:hypothetical protein
MPKMTQTHSITTKVKIACLEIELAAVVRLTPFDTNWRKGGGATPLTVQDLFFGDAISISTSATKGRGPG